MKRRAIAVLVIAGAACRSSSAPAPPPAAAPAAGEAVGSSGAAGSGMFEGRPIAPTMSYLGAGWLEREDREQREQPDTVLDALALDRSMVAADVGAGTGYFTVRLARRVAHVHATDVQPQMLEMLGARLGREHIGNVELHRGSDHDVALPEACCDVVLLVDVYHELADPPAILAGIRRALRAQGRLVLVEYRGEDPAVPIKPEHKMTLAQIRKEIEPRGFAFATSLEMLPDQRVVIFTRDDAARGR